jgi:hypothetical protein
VSGGAGGRLGPRGAEAPSKSPGPTAAPVGWVEGTPVPEAALEVYLGAMTASPVGTRLGAPTSPASAGCAAGAIKAWAAKVLLEDTLVRIEAARLGLEPASASLEDWVVRLEEKGVVKVEPPGEADALACYEANRHRYRVPEARAVRHRLFGRRTEADLFARRGCRSREGWVGLGWVERGQLEGALEEAIFSTGPSEVCGPVQSTFGWHFLAVEGVRPEGVLPFGECKEQILAEIFRSRRASAFRHWWLRRLAEAVVVPPGAEHPLQRGLLGGVHRH